MDRTILIGLDGATFTVLDSLVADGHLPNLGRLMGEGARGGLMSTPHPLTPPAWVSLMTGRNPGGHGIYDFLRGEVRGDAAFFSLNDYRDVACETIWSIISRRGGRVISLNFPIMAPPPDVEGCVVPGILSWRHLRRNVHPAGLYDRLRELPGFDAKAMSWDFEMETAVQNMDEDELEPWLEFHIGRERQWFRIAAHLMQAERWDLAAVMFDGVDKLQHACWRHLDPACRPERPDGQEARLRALCVEYFRNLDGFLGELVRIAGPTARVVIASDHGFGPSTRIFRVNKWLEQQGYLRWHADPAKQGGRPVRNSHFVHLDWEKTVAYTQSAACNGVHIRVRRAPGEPGIAPEDYGAFRDHLMAQLLGVPDPETGRPLLKAVLRREDVFPGEQMEKAPDLTLVPFDHGFVSVLDAEPVVAIRSLVKGTHYPEGILVAGGPGIRQGVVLPRQSIVDVAPTLLYSLGLPIPSDFEGRVIEGLFQPELLDVRPVEFGPPTIPPGPRRTQTQAKPDEEEQELVLGRLKALGYVE